MPETTPVPDRRKPLPVPAARSERRRANRRACPRWPLTFEVRYGAGKDMAPAEGYEIGEGGLSFTSEHSLSVESEINLEYRLHENAGWVKMKAVVRHARSKHVGAEFLNPRIKDRLDLLRFIAESKCATFPD